MSDAITDVERDSESIRLREINQPALICSVKDWHLRLRDGVRDLRNLGYKVDMSEVSLKIYKEF